jgi:hypothetical protein
MRKWIQDVGPGWKPIVEKYVPMIKAKGGFIMQVKEKFGGLRIYSQGGDYEAISDLERTAESISFLTCEYCGEPGNLKNKNGWIKTCCEKCNDTR